MTVEVPVIAGAFELGNQRRIDKSAGGGSRTDCGLHEARHHRAHRHRRAGIGIHEAKLAERRKARELVIPREQPPPSPSGCLACGTRRTRALYEDCALSAEAAEALDRLGLRGSLDAHDVCVVTALAWLELELPEPLVPEPLLPEPLVPEPLVPEPLALLAVAPELTELDPVAALDFATTALAAVLRASAGSWPETSCAKITVQSARKTATEIPITHRRIAVTRRWRARSRLATRR